MNMKHKKMYNSYVGIDIHKETHTAVIINCWNETLGEITFENSPSKFKNLEKKVNKVSKDLKPVYGLEDVHGHGRNLATYLLEKGAIVKEVNPALAFNKRKSNPTQKKNDTYDAYSVACVTFEELDKLPNANPTDHHWTLGQLASRREALVKGRMILKNQLHVQLSWHYPNYKKFFCGIDGKAAMAFWETYPSPKQLKGVTEKALMQVLNKACGGKIGKDKAMVILEHITEDGNIEREHQDSRDLIVKSLVKDIRFKTEEIKLIEKELEKVLDEFGTTLQTMPGIGSITAASLLAEIGDIRRFRNANKLACYAGIAPVKFSSAGKGKDQKSRQGNRKLNGIFYMIALQQIQETKRGVQRNPVFYAYHQKKISEGKKPNQSLMCIMRKLVSIVFGMLKHNTAYHMPEIQQEQDS